VPVQRLAGRWTPRADVDCAGGTSPVKPWPTIRAYFRCPDRVLGGVVEFLIDTGADQTIIMPNDRESICIPNWCLADGCPPVMGGIGGGLPVRYLHDVTLTFQAQDGSTLPPIALSRIAVADPPAASRRIYDPSPSLLGRDFLSLCSIDISEAGVFLEYETEEEEKDEAGEEAEMTD